MRFAKVVAACAALAVLGTIVLGSAGSSAVTPRRSAAVSQAVSAHHRSAPKPATADGLGIAPGKIKHVWLIILENKSYDASFTGLNRNTYLWQTLPRQGVLLKNYYGTGHFSQDNYLSLVSGQATESDTQDDCPSYNHFAGHVDLSGSLKTNPNYGQMTSAAGPNAAPGANGCVYPAAVPTLFNQLDKAHVSWKGYAQDLNNPDPAGTAPHSAGTNVCGAPFAQPGTAGSTTQPNPGSADATDQYVPKHFPFPWFESILGSGDCNTKHITNLFSQNDGLVHDLKHESTTPAFSWITPDNCSDAHDAVCHGNNLSGGFANPTTPKPPVNYTGGLYAADQFLAHVVPEIEASRAFKDGGLIDITFDEAFPPSPTPATASPTPPRCRPTPAPRSRTIPRVRRCSVTPCTRSRPGPTRRCSQTSRATSCIRVPATTPSSTGRAIASPRPRRSYRPEPACWAVGTASPARVPTPAPPPPQVARRSVTTRRSPPIPDAPSPAAASRPGHTSGR